MRQVQGYDEILTAIKDRLEISNWIEDGFWCTFFAKDLVATQGWKIHVSFTADEFSDFSSRIIEILIRFKYTFKIPSSDIKLRSLHSGQYGDDQIGKSMTVYPETIVAFKKIIQLIDDAWSDSNAPEVRGEPKFNGNRNVSFRFGDFKGRFFIDKFGRPTRYIVGDNGKKIEDSLEFTRIHVGGLLIPYSFMTEQQLQILIEIDSNYIVIKKFPRSASPTLLAICKITLKKVIIKIGSKKLNDRISDTYVMIQNETSVYEYLNQIGYKYCAKFIKYIDNGCENAIVIDYIEGASLANSQILDPENICEELSCAVGNLHKVGIIHGDLKEENVIISKEGKVYIIDFGTAGRTGSVVSLKMKTPGYYNVNKVFEFYTEDQDHYALNRIYFFIETGCKVTSIKSDTPTLVALYRNSPHRRLPRISYFLRSIEKQEEFNIRQISYDAIFNATMDFYDHSTSRWHNGHEFSGFCLSNLNIGAAGTILGLLGIRPHIKNISALDKVVHASIQTMRADDPQNNGAGLFTGNAGVALVVFLCGVLYKNDDYLNIAKNLICLSLSYEDHMDFYSGLSGALFVAILINESLNDSIIDELIVKATSCLVNNIQVRNGLIGVLNPISSEIDTGVAHGSAGIGYILFHLGEYLKDNNLTGISKRIFGSIRNSMSLDIGIFMNATRKMVADNSSWAQGTGGVLWALLDSFGDDSVFHDDFQWYLSLFEQDVHLSNPTLCHGMAGQLDLLKSLNSMKLGGDKSITLEKQLTECLKAMIIEGDQKQYLLSENLEYVTPELWIGFLGAACVLRTPKGKWSPIMSISYFRQMVKTFGACSIQTECGS